MLKFWVASVLVGAAIQVAYASDFSLIDMKGQEHSLKTHHGKWLLVNVWATWCAPCIDELPDLEALSREHDNLVVLGVAVDGAGNLALPQFLQKQHVTYPIVAGSPSEATQFSAKGYPTSILFDEAGNKVWLQEGVISRARIERFLAGGPH